MTDTPVTTVAAGTLPPTTQVVTASAHVSAIAKLKLEVFDVEQEIAKAWAAHEVLIVAVVSAIAGAIIGSWIFSGCAMPYSSGEDAAAHHAANTAAVAIPVASIFLHLPEVLTALVSIMGIIWYTILIYDWACKRRHIRMQIKQSADRVAVPILEQHEIDRHNDDTAHVNPPPFN